MWKWLSDFIIKYRNLWIIIAVVLLLFSTYNAFKISISHQLVQFLPESHPTMKVYRNFLDQYGPDGTNIFVGVEDADIFQLEHFSRWDSLANCIAEVDGVTTVLSLSKVFDLQRNDSLKQFQVHKVFPGKISSQKQLDSLRSCFDELVLYDGLLYNKQTNVTMMMVTFSQECLSSGGLSKAVGRIKSLVTDIYETPMGLDVKISGLPYIRTSITEIMKKEITFFTCLSIVIAAIILYLFFRSIKTLLPILFVVLVSVVFMFGFMGFFGFKVTVFTAILPPLLIIICVENSIFLYNKYCKELTVCPDKITALKKTIIRIGTANFLTNATTAASFVCFVVTKNVMLVQFGILSAINIFLAYVLTLFLIPSFLSYQKEPRPAVVSGEDSKAINRFIDRVLACVLGHRTWVYIISAVVVIVGILGLFKIKTAGSLVDDLSPKNAIYKDLMFFEKNFDGVMPLEISIDTKKPKGILNAATIKKIQQLQDTLDTYSEFGKPLSLVEAVKFSRQAFFKGKREQYKIPSNQELTFLMKYIPDMSGDGVPSLLTSFMDKEMSRTKVSVQIKNLTSPEINDIYESLKPKVDSIFPADKYEVVMTGSSIVFAQGNSYITRNLFISLLLAFVIISILVAFSFSSFKMVLIAILPNLIPQLMTAGLMGYMGIPIKTSTILVFSIALGISVDNTIHYLSRFRLHLKHNNLNVQRAVVDALHETGLSMICSAIVLMAGFFIFVFSSFGGTLVVGYMVPFTLMIALLTNLFILPSMILTFQRFVVSKIMYKRNSSNVIVDDDDGDDDELLIE